MEWSSQISGAAGIDILVSFVFGIGGRERSKGHLVETVKLPNILKPEEMAPMAPDVVITMTANSLVGEAVVSAIVSTWEQVSQRLLGPRMARVIILDAAPGSTSYRTG